MSARPANRRALQSAEKDDPIETTTFGDGLLNRQHVFDEYLAEVQEVPQILNRVNVIDVPLGDEHQLDYMGVDNRVIRATTEGSSGDEVDADDRTVNIDMVEIELPFSVSRRVAEQFIGGENSADLIMDLFGNQFAIDSEDLGFTGDEDETAGDVADTVGDASDWHTINDGWLQIALDENRDDVDHENATVDEEVFADLMRELDNEYKRDPEGLVYITSLSQKEAFKEYLTERDTAAGDAMLMTGEEPTPYGREIITPVGMPDDWIMLTDPQNLIWAVLRDMNLAFTTEGNRVVKERLFGVGNFTARTDYAIGDPDGVVVAENVASP